MPHASSLKVMESLISDSSLSYMTIRTTESNAKQLKLYFVNFWRLITCSNPCFIIHANDFYSTISTS